MKLLRFGPPGQEQPWQTERGGTISKGKSAPGYGPLGIAHLSKFMVLLPGDEVLIQIDGLGELRQRVVAVD